MDHGLGRRIEALGLVSWTWSTAKNRKEKSSCGLKKSVVSVCLQAALLPSAENPSLQVTKSNQVKVETPKVGPPLSQLSSHFVSKANWQWKSILKRF